MAAYADFALFWGEAIRSPMTKRQWFLPFWSCVRSTFGARVDPGNAQAWGQRCHYFQR